MLVRFNYWFSLNYKVTVEEVVFKSFVEELLFKSYCWSKVTIEKLLGIEVDLRIVCHLWKRLYLPIYFIEMYFRVFLEYFRVKFILVF